MNAPALKESYAEIYNQIKIEEVLDVLSQKKVDIIEIRGKDGKPKQK